MKNFFIVLFLIILNSCSINLYRPVDTSAIDIDKEVRKYLISNPHITDTLITFRKGDCQINSEDYYILIYKIKGITKSRCYCTSGNYPNEATIYNFNWNLIINSRDSILKQKIQPWYVAYVIEGDTTWHQKFGPDTDEPYFAFLMIINNDTTKWETSYTELNYNPSLIKSKITRYIFAETYNKTHGSPGIYGEKHYYRVPIISW